MSDFSILLVVAAVVRDAQGRILLAQRPPGKRLAGLWEFPGGKVDRGETPEAALARELHEELGLCVSPDDLVPLTFASHGDAQGDRPFHLFMPLYLCRRWAGDPHPHEGQSLAWVEPSRLSDYPMPPADEPLARFLARGGVGLIEAPASNEAVFFGKEIG